jgi:MoxR-like ATPase
MTIDPCTRSKLNDLQIALNQVILGKSELISNTLVCLLARGHILLEDLPGLGKTTLAKAIAAALGGQFARIQCTPDLLPSDVTGFQVFDQNRREFQFLPGPVFSDILLADEINRTSPRTQSSLLEAMAERQVTIDNTPRRLSNSFFVIATQNPVDQHGTYPLPEAQMDRFAMKLSLGYPNRENESQLLAEAIGHAIQEREAIKPVLNITELQLMQQHVSTVSVSNSIRNELMDLVTAVRSNRRFANGLSPRAVLMWQRLAQAKAFLSDRPFVIPDDIRNVAIGLLRLRISAHGDPDSIITAILDEIPVAPLETPSRMVS